MRSKWCISGTHLWGSNGNLHSLVPLVFFFLMASLSVPLCIPGYVPHDYILDSIAHAVHISSHLAYVAVCCQKPSKYPTHFRKLIGPQLVVEVLGLSKMSPTIKIFFFAGWVFLNFTFFYLTPWQGAGWWSYSVGMWGIFKIAWSRPCPGTRTALVASLSLSHFYVVAMHASTLHLVIIPLLLSCGLKTAYRHMVNLVY